MSFATVAQETAAPAPAPAPATEPAAEVKPATYSELLQKKYSLTEAEVKSLNDSKLNNEHQAMAARLARSSGKTIDEVLKMRTEDKMGWGKIAKTLGVAPGELGKAVSEMNKERNAARKAEVAEKNRVRKEKRDAERKARDEARAAKREEKRKDFDNKLRPNDKAKPEHEERGKNK
jgi:hypothetical protein